VYWYFTRWEDAGVTEKLLATLRIKAWVQQGRTPKPSAGIIDSQSVKGADTVGRDSMLAIIKAHATRLKASRRLLTGNNIMTLMRIRWLLQEIGEVDRTDEFSERGLGGEVERLRFSGAWSRAVAAGRP
jgi:hypothetical protein